MTAATFSTRLKSSSLILAILGLVAAAAAVPFDSWGSEAANTPSVATARIAGVAPALTNSDETATPICTEFHPEVGIGPPLIDGLQRTAIRPEADLMDGVSGGSSRPMRPTDDFPQGGRRQPFESRYSPADPSMPGRPSWQPPAPAGSTNEDTHQLKISSRSQDPRMQGLTGQASFNQITTLFAETSRLIDSRHVSPPSYEQRTAQALYGLAEAVGNPEFLAANRVNPPASAIQGLQQELSQLAQTQPARSANEAVGIMQWAAEISQQRIGIRREAAALEFLNEMIDSLDKYSALMPAKSQSGPSASLEERIVGIGVELKSHASGVLVTDVIDNGPAAAAGVRKGDVITAIENRRLAGMSLTQAADLIGGPQGSTVRLTLERDGRSLNASMQRQSVYVSSVVGAKFLDSQRKVGYLKVKQFSESTAEDLMKEMWTLYNAGMDSLVLDLRGNPGGLLSEAVDVCDIFIPSGTIVTTRGRSQADNSDFQAKRAETWKIPLVVLVDDHSASASEIFAAAIQENERGLIVGRKSYGKGTVQTHFPLQSIAGELKLTTAKFYSPTGREMAGQGVTPDMLIPQAPGAMEVDELHDPDLFAALQAVNSGRPAQLAEQAGRTDRQIGRVFGR